MPDLPIALQVEEAGAERTLRVEDLQQSDPAAGPGGLEATQALVLAKAEQVRLAVAALVPLLDGVEALLAGLSALASESTLESLRADVANGLGVTVSNPTADPETGLAKEAKQDTLIGHVDGLEGKDFATQATLTALAAKIPDEEGVWDYSAGSSGTVDVPANCRVIGIAAIATDAGASFSIDGGDSIPVPQDIGAELAPKGNLVAPQIVFGGTAAYVVEFLL